MLAKNIILCQFISERTAPKIPAATATALAAKKRLFLAPAFFAFAIAFSKTKSAAAIKTTAE